jgi:anti-sigma B factor antagonist
MATDQLYTSHSTDDVRVVTFQQGHILDAMTIDRMATGLKELIDRSPGGRLVFDFSKVTYLSSSALGMLIGLQRRAVQNNAGLKLAGISEEIMEVFRITKLDTVFDIYKDGASAIEAHRKNL